MLDGVDLPPVAFCVPFLDAALQLAFVTELTRRGCLTAANTYSCAAEAEADLVRSTADSADVFFCNEAEAELLFGSPEQAAGPPGKLRFVTLGARGVLVLQGGHATRVPGVPAEMLDPTGAGDTFCGTVLARLAAGDHPVAAARRAVEAAAATVEAVGPAALLGPPDPPRPASGPAHVRAPRVAALAAVIAGTEEAFPFPFTGEVFPPAGDPAALVFFFAATAQQYGFWSIVEGRYGAPAYATMGGDRLKGSDYLWEAYRRWAAADPNQLAPGGQARVDDAGYARRMAADGGEAPLPALGLHAASARAYGETMSRLGWTPESVVATAAASPRPLAALLRMLDHVGGYREDPLRKKSALLGIELRQRPEAWLPDSPGDDAPPIVDYHVQRTCLRTGMVDVGASLRRRLAARRLVEEDQEEAVRRAAYDAVALLAELSGKPMGAVDWFLFQMRHRCPEMTEPRCEDCPALPACEQRIDLFQPVRRTTFY
jgi:hypothetical protein